MDDDEYAALQLSLIEHPHQGKLVPGSGGLRKIRWAADRSKGKSGGARVIYYWAQADDQILMLYAYRKARRENLTAEQIRLLRRIVERWK